MLLITGLWRPKDSFEQRCHFCWVFYDEDFELSACGEWLDQENITTGEERCFLTVSR